MNSWNANGQKNGWPTANPSEASTFDDVFNLGVRTPGYVHIPVCDAETAWYNWFVSDTGKSDYPCTPIPNDRKRDAVALQWSEELEAELQRRCYGRICLLSEDIFGDCYSAGGSGRKTSGPQTSPSSRNAIIPRHHHISSTGSISRLHYLSSSNSVSSSPQTPP